MRIPDANFYNGKIITLDYAYTTWDEKLKGSIEPGKLADCVILSGDFMTVPEEPVPGRKRLMVPDAKNGF